MDSSRIGRRRALFGGLAVVCLLPFAGCQAEYAGMTLPSGKYMHDDVQYFPSGPDFPWANTQAATQRARMSAMGEAYGLAPMPSITEGPVVTPPSAPGAPAGVQNLPFRGTDVNVSPFSNEPPPGAPAAAPAAQPEPPGAMIPPPGGPTVPGEVPR